MQPVCNILSADPYFVTMSIAMLYNVTCAICNALHSCQVKKSQLFVTCVKCQTIDDSFCFWICNGRPGP